MDKVRYIIPIVYGTLNINFIKDMEEDSDYARCNTLDFSNKGNLFSTTIKEVRYQVFQKRYDIYCERRIYKRDDSNYALEINILLNLGFQNADILNKES